jgi:regulatory protein
MHRAPKEIEVIISKLEQFCLFRDRTRKEVLDRMGTYDLPEEWQEDVLNDLENRDLVNEGRFAREFAVGKHRSRKWGRIKIQYELRSKGMDPPTIRMGLESIDQDEYVSTLGQLLEQKSLETKAKNEFERNKKLAQKLIRKGYESDLVWDLIRKDR